MTEQAKGSLTIVGTGITISGQMTLYSESIIKNADIVLAVVMDSALTNLQKLNANVVCMKHYYEKGTPRLVTYDKMKQHMVDEAVAGKKVVAAFYGHPGVFVNASHEAVKELKEMGISAEMLPGISAEDCLIADLGLDPAHYGCQSYEATKFLFRQYTIDPYMMQIIWQIGVIAEFSYVEDRDEHPGMAVLQEALLKYYPKDHEVIVYEAATIPVASPRIERVPLCELATVVPKVISTLVIPSIGLQDFDRATMAKFGLTPESLMKKLNIFN